MSGPTIVVRFGEGVESGELFVVQMDNELNRDSGGEVKTQFYPGDEIFFLLHYDASRLRVRDIRTTSGQVVVQGQVARSNTQELLFVDTAEPIDLPHMPTGTLTAEWYGREAVLIRQGRQVSASAVPCIGDVTYQYPATSCRLVPPPIELEDDEEYPIAVVIYVDEVAA